MSQRADRRAPDGEAGRPPRSPDFAKAGADIISFHPEASEHVDRTIGLIREQAARRAWCSIPATPLDYLDYVLDKLDLVLLMSVNPGLRRADVHPLGAAKIARGAQAHRRHRARHLARGRRRHQGRQHRARWREPAPTRSSPARRSSTVLAISRQSMRSVRPPPPVCMRG